MKFSSGALRSFCASQSATPRDLSAMSCELYTFRLVGGGTLYYTTWTVPIVLAQGSIASSTLAVGGTGYAVGDTGFIQGVTMDAMYTISSVSSGVVTGYTISMAGSLYQVWANCITSPGGSQRGLGKGLQINVTGVSANVTFVPPTPASPNVPIFNRSNVKQSTGFSVDTLTIKIAASPATQVNGLSFQTALDAGVFDGATVLVQRLIMPTPGDTSLGTYTVFSGAVSDVTDIGIISSKMKVKSAVNLLSIYMPRNLYQAGCINTLFDTGCGLSRTSFLVTGAVQSGSNEISISTSLTQPSSIAPPSSAPSLSTSTPSGVNLSPTTYYVTTTYVSALGETTASPEAVINAPINSVITVASPPTETGAVAWNVYVGTAPMQEQRQNGSPIAIGTNWTEGGNGLQLGSPAPIVSTGGYFSQGVITFTSGANNGLSRYIRAYGSGTVSLLIALPHPPGTGDTFNIVPGCDHQQTTCSEKYSNIANFRGNPYIPSPESTT